MSTHARQRALSIGRLILVAVPAACLEQQHACSCRTLRWRHHRSISAAEGAFSYDGSCGCSAILARATSGIPIRDCPVRAAH